MAVCIQCDSEALKGSDYCAVCEEREFKKIRGWLYIPALGLIATIIVNLISINFTLRFLMENFALIGSGQKGDPLFRAGGVCRHVCLCAVCQQPLFS